MCTGHCQLLTAQGKVYLEPKETRRVEGLKRESWWRPQFAPSCRFLSGGMTEPGYNLVGQLRAGIFTVKPATATIINHTFCIRVSSYADCTNFCSNCLPRISCFPLHIDNKPIFYLPYFHCRRAFTDQFWNCVKSTGWRVDFLSMNQSF